MNKFFEFFKSLGGLSRFARSEAGQKRANLRTLLKSAKKLRRMLKRDKFTDKEKEKMQRAYDAILKSIETLSESN